MRAQALELVQLAPAELRQNPTSRRFREWMRGMLEDRTPSRREWRDLVTNRPNGATRVNRGRMDAGCPRIP